MFCSEDDEKMKLAQRVVSARANIELLLSWKQQHCSSIAVAKLVDASSGGLPQPGPSPLAVH